MISVKENNLRLVHEVFDDLKEQKVKLLLASFSDLHGSMRAKLVPTDSFHSICEKGAGFAGYAVGDLGHGPHDPDILCIPDLRSKTVLPWKKEVAWFSGTLTEDGTPWPYCSRTILLKVVEQAKKLGYTMKTGVEPEFFLVKKNEKGQIVPFDEKDVSAKPCYQQQALMRNVDFLGTLMDYMNELGWGVYQGDHEDANGQFELNWQYADAVTSADRHLFFKFMVSSMAEERDLIATFMPKPFSHLTGNGSHMHLSLWDQVGQNNFFFDEKDKRGMGMSKIAYHFIGGLMRHAAACAAVIAPTVNSYKRLSARTSASGATWAPNFITYGGNNRTQFLRIPAGGRVEYRAMDGSANPYLSAAVILAAGLDGIINEIDPGEPFDVNLYQLQRKSVGNREINLLPSTLKEAVEALEQDDVIMEALGREFTRVYIDRKMAEWEEYHHQVSAWEVEKYLTSY